MTNESHWVYTEKVKENFMNPKIILRVYLEVTTCIVLERRYTWLNSR